ncbi:hypothetical protein OPQ81_010413 [Rhizoctonia solani]|nr:hypothetical protein OPQ81_010413 [Rhizoctonia solani]
MYSEVLLWFAEMRQLSSLELLIDPGDSEEPLSLPEVSYPNNAFHNLATLKVYTSDHGDTVEECNLLKQLWKTPLVRHLTCVEIMLSSPIYPDMKEFDQFMTILVTHSPKVSSLLLRASGSPEHFPEITIEVLESARRLPIRTLNVQSPIHLGAEQPLFKSFGGTFARLEDLDLSSTAVEVSDLLSAHGYLPQLRYLNIGVWQTKTNKKKLERALFPKNTGPWIVPTQRPLGTSLLIGFRKRNSAPRICAYNLDFFDIDLLAMLLAVRWANIHVHGDLLADRMESLRSRIDLWRGKACRGR